MLHAHPIRVRKRWLLLLVIAGVFVGFACQQEVERIGPPAMKNQVAHQSSVYEQVEQMPVYPGGSDQLLEDLNARVVSLFPMAAAKAANLNGKVLIDYIIDSVGVMRTTVIKQAAIPKLSQEIVAQQASEAGLQAVQGLKAHWKPGYKNGQAVAVRGTLTLIFQSQPYTLTGVHKDTQGRWYSLIWLVR